MEEVQTGAAEQVNHVVNMVRQHTDLFFYGHSKKGFDSIVLCQEKVSANPACMTLSTCWGFICFCKGR